jgi:hypothetical protein
MARVHRPFFTVVTKGDPAVALKPFYGTELNATLAALNACGTGYCTGAQVLRCKSLSASKTATYGRVRARHESLAFAITDAELERKF